MLTFNQNTYFKINDFHLVIKSHLGKFADVDYYKVIIQDIEQTNDVSLDSNNLGLLRIGDINGGLSRELQLRHMLKESVMLSELLTYGVESSCLPIESKQPLEVNYETSKLKAINIELNNTNYILESDSQQLAYSSKELLSSESYFGEIWETNNDYNYLEDEVLENQNISSESKLVLLSCFPKEKKTLGNWLQNKRSCPAAISVIHQVCQLFQEINQKGWCFFQLIPQFVEVDSTVKFFDLTNICLLGETIIYSRETEYCAPEVTFNFPASEGMSVYIIGTLLYQAIYHQLPNTRHNSSFLDRQPIPGIYQIISLCLLPMIQERISLNQLVKALGETQQTFSKCKVQWDVASSSTIGLSMQRLHNEDSYAVQQHSSSDKDTILAVLADGMGGLAQGEIASYLAVKTIIEAPINRFNDSDDNENHWLVSMVQEANKCVVENVDKGGTTLSIVWANSRHLRIAHVGDSRIYLIRKKILCQLSEDHSLVAMLLADGEIAYEESQNHPQRNILTKCIGSKITLNSNYIQTLHSFGSDSSILLEQDDIVILCSDGVWDLISPIELSKIFTDIQNLKIAVDTTINLVLTRGARDNATIIAMKCNLLTQY